MKNAYKSSNLRVHLQGFVNGTVDTDHTSACDLKSVVLPAVHMKQFRCDRMLMTSDVCSRVKSGTANTLFNTGFISDEILCN
jgi:hypothetical protein